jgi:AraC-like DNA-binding protein
MKIERKPCTSPFFIWNGISAFYYSSHITPFHSHNNLQLIFDIQDRFKLQTKQSDWRNYKSVVIKENTIHRLDTNKSVQLIIYIDPSSNIAERIQSTFLNGCEISDLNNGIRDLIPVGMLQKSLLNPDESISKTLIQEIIKNLICGITKCSKDDRINQIEKFIQHDPTFLSTQTLAAKVFLSESRLRVLFKQQTGVSIHKNILWNRMIQSIGQLMNGSNIADAALYAGFEDSSHLHKTMAKIFGVHPAAFVKSNKIFNIVSYDRSPLKIESVTYSDQFIPEHNIVC